MRTGSSVGAVLYWGSVVLAALSLVLVVTNVVLVSNNQSIQADVNQRQQFINQSMQLSRVNEALVRALASEAVNAKDDKVRDLLAQQGITVTVTPPGTASTPQTPTAATPEKK